MKLTVVIAIITIAACSLYRYSLPNIPAEQRDPIWIEIRGTNINIRGLPGIDEGYVHFWRLDMFKAGWNVEHLGSVGGARIGNVHAK